MAALLHNGRVIQDPPFVRTLFSNPRTAVLWLALRIWLGYQWIEAALLKVSNPAWMQSGNALKASWTAAAQNPVSAGWYRSIIQFLLDGETYTWVAKIVTVGELLIGIALILGAFTGIAAFFGAMMNWNFMMAGAASSNPLLFVIALGIVMAWKIAGYMGLDYFLLPLIGTPWGRKHREKSTGSSQKD